MNGKIWTEEEFLEEIHKSGEDILITKDRLKEILQENLKLQRLNDSQAKTIETLQSTIKLRNERIDELQNRPAKPMFDRMA